MPMPPISIVTTLDPVPLPSSYYYDRISSYFLDSGFGNPVGRYVGGRNGNDQIMLRAIPDRPLGLGSEPLNANFVERMTPTLDEATGRVYQAIEDLRGQGVYSIVAALVGYLDYSILDRHLAPRALGFEIIPDPSRDTGVTLFVDTTDAQRLWSRRVTTEAEIMKAADNEYMRVGVELPKVAETYHASPTWMTMLMGED